MPKAIQSSLAEEEKRDLLSILEKQGKAKWFERRRVHMAFPFSLNPLSQEKQERERALRYLLLRALINQQARFEKVREISVRLREEFKDILLFEPYKISESRLFKVFKDIAGEKGSLLYRVGALGGIKPLSLFAHRFKAYEGFIRWLNKTKQSFLELIVSQLENRNPWNLFEYLNTHAVLEAGWVGNDPKACRMFVNWCIFLFNEI